MTLTYSTHEPHELSTVELYAILKLRTEVFIVEQRSCYPDLDGHDLETDTVHLTATENGKVLCTVRVLNKDSATARIGRVVTAKDARGRGLARELMQRAVELCLPTARIELTAQTHLENWYEKFGFSRCGSDFDDEGIMHLPMLRESSAATA